jgi:TldD protein
MKDLAEFSIKYLEEKGASYAEARLETTTSEGFILKDGNLEISGFDQITGLGIRYLLNKNLGFISLNDLNKKKLKDQLDASIRKIKKSSKISKEIRFSENKPHVINYRVKPKKLFSTQEKIRLLLDLNKVIETDHSYLSLSDTITEKYYVNTEGSKINSIIPRVNFFYFLTIIENQSSIQRYLQLGAASGYEIFDKWKLDKKIPEEINALKNNLRHGIKPPKGTFDIVCAPEITGIAVHESVGHPYEADRILGREAAQAGESFVTKEMLNTKIGSNIVTVVDDPTLKNSFGFYLYDDEGVKAKERVLIKNGIINDFLHNRESSAEMGLKSNGSARANNYSNEPLVRMANTYLKPGTSKEEELIKETKKGIYLKSFMEWNIDDKRYHAKYVGNEAYLIENGEITKPIRNPALEITTPKFWSSIDLIANNLEFFAGTCGKGEPMQGIPVFMGGPSIRLRKIKLN